MVCVSFSESNSTLLDGTPVEVNGERRTFCAELNNEQRKTIFETGVLYITIEPNEKPKIET